MMAKSFEEVFNKLPEAERAQIIAESERLYAEYQTVKEFHKAREFAHTQLAEQLNVRPATVALIEKRGDLMLSALRSHVEAMGGSLSVVVEFPNNVPIFLKGFCDTEEPMQNTLQNQQLLSTHQTTGAEANRLLAG